MRVLNEKQPYMGLTKGMSETNIAVVGQTRTPIIQPLFSNRFRVEIEAYPELTRSVTDIEIRLLQSELVLHLREDIDLNVLKLIASLVKGFSFNVAVCSVNPTTAENNAIKHFRCKVKDHTYRLAYESAEMSVHTLVLSTDQ